MFFDYFGPIDVRGQRLPIAFAKLLAAYNSPLHHGC
jgi:hypothetical protein